MNTYKGILLIRLENTRTKKYDPIKKAENHKIAKQNATNKRKKQYENQVYSKKSIEKLKENAIEKHLAFKEKTRKRFKDINNNLSKTLT